MGRSGGGGPLLYTWQSDCLMGDIPWGQILFPYDAESSGGSGDVPFTLYVTLNCYSIPRASPCPSTVPAGPSAVEFGLWGDNSLPADGGTIAPGSFYETLPNQDLAPPKAGNPTGAFQLPVGQKVAFAQFWPDGQCEVLLPKTVDCQH